MEQLKRSYYLEVWRDIEDKIIGSDVTDTKGFPELREWFDYHYTVHGKTATVYLFYSDYEITPKEMTEFAIKFMKGEYVTIHVNLATVNAIQSKGVDKTVNPR